jgi:hypothetical protein
LDLTREQTTGGGKPILVGSAYDKLEHLMQHGDLATEPLQVTIGA